MKHSDKYDIVKSYYDKGLWSEQRIKLAVEKGWITEEECNEILYTNEEIVEETEEINENEEVE